MVTAVIVMVVVVGGWGGVGWGAAQRCPTHFRARMQARTHARERQHILELPRCRHRRRRRRRRGRGVRWPARRACAARVVPLLLPQAVRLLALVPVEIRKRRRCRRRRRRRVGVCRAGGGGGGVPARPLLFLFLLLRRLLSEHLRPHRGGVPCIFVAHEPRSLIITLTTLYGRLALRTATVSCAALLMSTYEDDVMMIMMMMMTEVKTKQQQQQQQQ